MISIIFPFTTPFYIFKRNVQKCSSVIVLLFHLARLYVSLLNEKTVLSRKSEVCCYVWIFGGNNFLGWLRTNCTKIKIILSVLGVCEIWLNVHFVMKTCTRSSRVLLLLGLLLRFSGFIAEIHRNICRGYSLHSDGRSDRRYFFRG